MAVIQVSSLLIAFSDYFKKKEGERYYLDTFYTCHELEVLSLSNDFVEHGWVILIRDLV